MSKFVSFVDLDGLSSMVAADHITDVYELRDGTWRITTPGRSFGHTVSKDTARIVLDYLQYGDLKPAPAVGEPPELDNVLAYLVRVIDDLRDRVNTLDVGITGEFSVLAKSLDQRFETLFASLEQSAKLDAEREAERKAETPPAPSHEHVAQRCAALVAREAVQNDRPTVVVAIARSDGSMPYAASSTPKDHRDADAWAIDAEAALLDLPDEIERRQQARLGRDPRSPFKAGRPTPSFSLRSFKRGENVDLGTWPTEIVRPDQEDS